MSVHRRWPVQEGRGKNHSPDQRPSSHALQRYPLLTEDILTYLRNKEAQNPDMSLSLIAICYLSQILDMSAATTASELIHDIQESIDRLLHETDNSISVF